MRNIERIERKLSEALDPEREAWEAAQYQFIRDGLRIVKSPNAKYRALYNSFLTGTSAEVIYSNANAGTSNNTFTTERIANDVAGMGPQPILPPYFFLPSGSSARALRVVARGILSTTGSPTFTLTSRGGAAVNVSAAPLLAGSLAVTAGATQTNSLWEAEWDTQLTIAGGTGANSTIRSLGFWTIQLSTTTAVSAPLFGGAASPGTVAVFDISTTNYIAVNVTCGTSSASNIFQLLQLIVMGLN